MSKKQDEQIQRFQYNEQLGAYRKVVGDVAHDLNNLLLLISGYSEMLAKNIDNRSQVFELVEKIQVATLSVRDLTNKLQAIAHIEDPETIDEDLSIE